MLNNPKFSRFLVLLVLILITLNIFVIFKVKEYEETRVKELLENQTTLKMEVETLEYRLSKAEIGYVELINMYCKQYNVDPKLVMAIVKVESDFNPNALSNKGAVGLMQIMPSTYTWIRKNYKLKRRDLRNPDTNLEAGIIYLAVLKDKHKDIRKVLAEYNGGPRLASNYPNTNSGVVAYVDKVMGYYR